MTLITLIVKTWTELLLFSESDFPKVLPQAFLDLRMVFFFVVWFHGLM
jgi:hypothetical protein